MSEEELKNYGDLILKNIEEQVKHETNLMLQNKRYKEVLDKIKEYAEENKIIGVITREENEYMKHILELLEEIE